MTVKWLPGEPGGPGGPGGPTGPRSPGNPKEFCLRVVPATPEKYKYFE